MELESLTRRVSAPPLPLRLPLLLPPPLPLPPPLSLSLPLSLPLPLPPPVHGAGGGGRVVNALEAIAAETDRARAALQSAGGGEGAVDAVEAIAAGARALEAIMPAVARAAPASALSEVDRVWRCMLKLSKPVLKTPCYGVIA